jgi:hypothetical protein
MQSLFAKGNNLVHFRIVLLMVLCILIPSQTLAASEREYHIKAAIIYKLTKFVSWPEDTLSNASYLGICLLGEDNFGHALNDLESRNSKGKPIKIYRFQLSTGISDQCHLVFIEKSRQAFLSTITQQMSQYPILTVSDMPGFAAKGGILELASKQGKITFIINLSQLKTVKLEATAPLLGLAKIINSNIGD